MLYSLIFTHPAFASATKFDFDGANWSMNIYIWILVAVLAVAAFCFLMEMRRRRRAENDTTHNPNSTFGPECPNCGSRWSDPQMGSDSKRACSRCGLRFHFED